MDKALAKIYVVATPIGNLEDISQRAVRILGEVDMIAAEDTRVAGKLLKLLKIKPKQLISYHDQNEQLKFTRIIEQLLSRSQSLALISDAGTPCISDPGYRLIAAARKNGIPVFPIPGPSALTSVVSASGLPSDQLHFVGFLPRKKTALEGEVASWKSWRGSVVFFESARRLKVSLALIQHQHPSALVCIGRELTKLYEETIVLPINEALHWCNNHRLLKGEVVAMVHIPDDGSHSETVALDKIREHAARHLRHGESFRDIMAKMKDCGLSRKDLYQVLLSVKNQSSS